MKLPEGYRLRTLDGTASTSLDCIEAIRGGEGADRLWIVAAEQTKGKGSRGRQWVSSRGNLFASLALREPGEAETIATLTFAFGLAIRDSLSSFAPEKNFSLKWPNDVLLDGAKVSGLLLESSLISGIPWVVAGIGINCASHPRNVSHKATCLAECGIPVEPNALFPRLAVEVDRRLRQWNRGEGFASIRSDWLERSAGKGSPIRLRMGDEELCGVFESLDPNGLLLLRESSGTLRKVSAADIFLMEGASHVEA